MKFFRSTVGAGCACLAIATLLSSACLGNTIRVQTTGNNANDGSTWALAKKTITAALAAATSGDQIWVAAGKYSERITLKDGVGVYGGFAGFELVLEDRNPFTNVTIIDGGAGGSVVTAPAGISTAAIVDGFTIQNGKAANGGGVSCASGASPTISNDIITGNTATGKGGGVYVWNSSGVLDENQIQKNSAQMGGGVFCETGSSVSISYDTISANQATDGGGVYCNSSSPSITNGSISGNSATNGAGVYCNSASPIIASTDLSQNTASSSGGGLFLQSSPVNMTGGSVAGNQAQFGAGIFSASSSPSISQVDVAGNQAALGGGGLYGTGSGGTFSNDTFELNTAPTGAGIYLDKSTTDVRNSTVTSNTATSNGGGVYLSGSSPVISNNSIYFNTGPNGAGIYCTSAPAAITNNTIYDNASRLAGGGIACYSSPGATVSNNVVLSNTLGVFVSGSAPAFWNNDVYSNSSYNYQGVPTPPNATNISKDPLLVDPSNSDFHLTLGSPCIDAGRNSAPGLSPVDLDGEPRIQGGVVDIGVDEFTEASTGIVSGKRGGDTSQVQISGRVVTAAFPDFFYIEADGRENGIRVYLPGHLLSAGMRAGVIGRMATNSDGERYIQADAAAQTGTGSLLPLGMNNRAVGGGDWFYNAATGAGQRGVLGGAGLNNVGLFVRVWGMVTSVSSGAGSFTIADGASVSDPSGNAGITVRASGLTLPPRGSYVIVTGACSTYGSGGNLYPQILAPSQASIVVVPQIR